MYHGFHVKITPMKNIQREKEGGETINCEGFQIEIFYDDSEKLPLNVFTAAVGHEIFGNSMDDAEQFAQDVIENEEKEYYKMISELENSTNT